ILLALALLLGFDNWRTGMHWESDAPQAGYFPFYLSLLLGGASLFGLISKLVEKGTFETFVTHQQLRRGMQVFVPTLLFCVAMQWLGPHSPGFLLMSGVLWVVGAISPLVPPLHPF